MSSAVPAQSQRGSHTEDRYAALAELDNELSTTVSTGSSVQGWEADVRKHTPFIAKMLVNKAPNVYSITGH